MIEPKPAATVVVARDSPAGPEVLLLRRTDTAAFMPGAHVFPGGAVDRQDHDPALLSHAAGVDIDRLNRLLEVDDGGPAFLVAAIRECFEEAGLLLADPGPGGPPDVNLDRRRREVTAGELTLAALCRDLDLRLRTDRMAYLGRWITPPGGPRRFDTRFFIAPVPPGQSAVHDGVETTAHLWITPANALERCRRGELVLGNPTVNTLRRLSGFDNVDRLLAHAPLTGASTDDQPFPADGRDGVRWVSPSEPAYAEIARLRAEGLTASYEIIPGVARRLSRRVTRLTAANPGVMTGPGTNTYLVDGGDGLAVIDPGPALIPHMEAILEQAGTIPIRAILATHTHRDHSPGARALRERTGAPVMGMAPPDDPGNDQDFAPGRVLRPGERVQVGDATIRAIHTPGHASNHLCFLLEEERLLFSGDHIMQGSTVVIGPPDGNMKDYLRSLEALHTEDIACIAPGHGFLMSDAGMVIDRIIRHRMKREAKVANAVRRLGPATEETLVAAVYDDVPAALHGVARRSLLAHLIKLRDEEFLRDTGGLWRPAD